MSEPYKNPFGTGAGKTQKLMDELSLLWTFLLSRFRVTLLLTGFLAFAGYGAFNSIVRESNPDVEVPIAIIQTVWPGASAVDIEKLVTNKIEKEVKAIEDLKKYNSTSRQNISVVTVEFEQGSDMDKNLQKVREALDDAERNLPATLPDSPALEAASVSNTPVMTLALSGDYSYRQLKTFAEELQTDFESINGVREVVLSGVSEEEFHLYIDPVRLEGLGLSLDQVTNALSSAHKDIPLGSIFVDGQEIQVRVEGQLEDSVSFMNIPLLENDGKIIRLIDIGEIRKEFDTMKVESLISTEGRTASRFVSLDLLKSKAQTDVIKVINEANALIASKQASGQIPEGLAIDMVFDGAADVTESLRTLTTSMTQTIVLIGILLLLALGWREALLSFIALPLSLFIGILILYLGGDTFNFISLFALVLALGLLVDNAIIITEGISEAIFERKLSPDQAARYAIAKFRWPMIAGTLTTVFAFLPMLFVISGVSGEFMSVMPRTVTWVLLGSIFVSLFILPIMGAKFFTWFPPSKPKEFVLLRKFQNWYTKQMNEVIIKTRAGVYITTLVGVGVMVFAFSLMGTGKIPIEVFPASDQNYFTMKIELPKGTPRAETKKLVAVLDSVMVPYYEAEKALSVGTGDSDFDKTWLKSYTAFVGQMSPYDPVLQQGGLNLQESHILGVTVNLIDKNKRDVTSLEIMPALKESLEGVLPDNAELTVSILSNGPPSGSSPIEAKIYSDDLERLEVLAEELKGRYVDFAIEGKEARLINVRDNLGDSLPQLTWSFDREALQRYGLSPQGISSSLNSAIEGVTVLQVSEGDEEIDLVARFDFESDRLWDEPTSLDILQQVPIRTAQGSYVSLAEIATPEIKPQRTSLRHRDGNRYVAIGADIEGTAAPTEFNEALFGALESLELQSGERYEVGGDSEETNRLVAEMGLSMLIGVFLILMLLVLQFDSFLQSLVVVSLLPLSLTGVFVGFWLSGTPIGFPSMIGIVALAGIIVNDAIVFIDQINQNEKHGMNKYESMVQAGRSRMQPILLTSVTTIFGLLPLSLSDPVWKGLGFAIIYGMTLATVLTLIMVPCLIIIYEDVSLAPKRLFLFLKKILKN